MNNIQHCLALLCAALLMASCQKEEQAPEYNLFFAAPLYAQFEVRDTGQTEFEFRSYHLDSYKSSDAPPYSWITEEPPIDERNALAINLRSLDEPFYPYLFGLKFWTDEGNSIQRDETSLAQFFEAGRIFEFGKGTGKVDIGLPATLANMPDDTRSRASYLTVPSGQLTIVQAAPYSYRLPGGQSTKGLLVSCMFEGSLGIYNSAALHFQGDDYRTDVAVPVQNGEAAFFIPCE